MGEAPKRNYFQNKKTVINLNYKKLGIFLKDV